MEIKILQQIEGAKKAEGLAVIIDVFRAFSLECYLAAKGAGRILPVGAEETARRLKEEHPEYVLVGERHGVILPGFAYGNSPSQTEGANLQGRVVVHTTSAGTQGIVQASQAEEIITGSLVNAGAIARYIKKRGFSRVSLVCMGLEGRSEAWEDTLCGRYIKSLLEGQAFDLERELLRLREQPSARKFFQAENQAVFPERDYWMCVDADRFDFVLKVERLSGDVFEARRIQV